MNNQKQILIADDDRDLVELIAMRCSQLGFGVHKAHDGISALKLIDDLQPDLVLLDVNMPSGNGLGICEILSDDEHLRNIPVVIMSGRTDTDTIRRCHNLMAYYVEKCSDVWSRLEPLITELVPVGRVSEPVQTEHRPRIPDTPSGESINQVDALFAVFGWDENFLETADETVSPQSDTRPWVLCIDDDSELTYSLKLRLQQQGVEVVRAFAGKEGVRYAFTSPAQAIILDYEMPNGNGDYVLRRLKDNPVTRDIPVIVLTGRKDKSIERQMYNLGATSFFTKPVTFQQLWNELGQYISAPTA